MTFYMPAGNGFPSNPPWAHTCGNFFFLREKALRVPQFANINSLICNKCYAGLPCLSQFTPEVSSLETNVVSTRRRYPGHLCNINKAAQGTKKECSSGILIYRHSH